MRGFDPLYLVHVLAMALAGGGLTGCGYVARSTTAAAPVAEPTNVIDLRPFCDAERVLRTRTKAGITIIMTTARATTD